MSIYPAPLGRGRPPASERDLRCHCPGPPVRWPIRAKKAPSSVLASTGRLPTWTSKELYWRLPLPTRASPLDARKEIIARIKPMTSEFHSSLAPGFGSIAGAGLRISRAMPAGIAGQQRHLWFQRGLALPGGCALHRAPAASARYRCVSFGRTSPARVLVMCRSRTKALPAPGPRWSPPRPAPRCPSSPVIIGGSVGAGNYGTWPGLQPSLGLAAAATCRRRPHQGDGGEQAARRARLPSNARWHRGQGQWSAERRRSPHPQPK